jgi:HAD superfamily hydrolase (TIGR01549 family)
MKAAVFDMDGTLIDTFPAILGCVNEVLAEMGAEQFAPEELKPLVGSFIGDIYASKGVDPAAARARHRVVYLERYSDKSRPYPGAIGALRAIKSGGVRTAVVTMRMGEIARSVLANYGFIEHLDLVLGEDEVARAKPDPEHVLSALRKLGVEPKDACMVGDTEHDMHAAIGAGCMPIGVAWGYGNPQSAGKVRMVKSFGELADVIFSH